jgi:multidrug efflux pump subunit AcrA (membrane-fusion protein)
MHTRGHAYWIALLPIILLPAGCREKAAESKQAAPAAIAVTTVQVESREAEGFVELTGSLAGGRGVALSTKLMSQITSLSVQEGERVAAGQTLVVLDDSDIVAMRSEAAAYRAEASAALAEVEAVVAQSGNARKAAEAAVKQAEAVYEESKKDLERTERLVAEDTLPRVQADKARLAVKVAEENLNQARSGVEQAGDAIRQAEARRPQVEAKQQQASAKDQQAAALQDYAVLKAPFDGVITRKFFESGQLAIPGQPILMLEDEQAFKVELAIPEELAASQILDSRMDVVLEQAGEEPAVLSGTLSLLGAAADPASHVVAAELSLPEAPGLMSGRFVRVRVPSGKRTQLLVPLTALVHEAEEDYVWRVTAGGLAARVPVEAGETADGRVEILRGLSEGDQVIDEPGPDLYPGARVSASSSSGGNE